MRDEQIVEMYWQRSESAIAETKAKYGAYCNRIAYGILECAEDAQECENDTYLAAWNAMPPHRPAVLAAFLGKLPRSATKDATSRPQSAVPIGTGHLGIDGDFIAFLVKLIFTVSIQ